MKRWQKIVVLLVLALVLWLWSYFSLSTYQWLAIPLGVLVMVAAYAAVEILGSIAKIREFPEEKTSL